MSYSASSFRCPYHGKLKTYSLKYFKANVTINDNEERLPCKCCGQLLSAEDTKTIKRKVFGKGFMGAFDK